MSCGGTYTFQRYGRIKVGRKTIRRIKDVDIKVDGEREREEIIYAGLNTVCGVDGMNPELEIVLDINLYDQKGLAGFFKKWRRNTVDTINQEITLWPGDGSMLVLQADNQFGMELISKSLKPATGKNRPRITGSMSWKGYFKIEPEWVMDTSFSGEQEDDFFKIEPEPDEDEDELMDGAASGGA